MKTTIVTMAGRQPTLSILKNYLLKSRHLFDEWHLLLNTNKPLDVKYIYELSKEYSWIKIFDFNQNLHHSKAVHKCIIEYPWKNDVIYLRIDDDIVYIPTISIENWLNAIKTASNDTLIVSCNVVNNSICAFLQQQNNIFTTDYNLQFIRTCPASWRNPLFAMQLHNKFLQTTDHSCFNIPDYIFEHHELLDGISVNAIGFFGSKITQAFQTCLEYFKTDEEGAITIHCPKILKQKVAICGSATVVHYAFYKQKKFLDTTDILEKYRLLSIT